MIWLPSVQLKETMVFKSHLSLLAPVLRIFRTHSSKPWVLKHLYCLFSPTITITPPQSYPKPLLGLLGLGLRYIDHTPGVAQRRKQKTLPLRFKSIRSYSEDELGLGFELKIANSSRAETLNSSRARPNLNSNPTLGRECLSKRKMWLGVEKTPAELVTFSSGKMLLR